ncbi:MAG: S41 family peptidase [Bacteroidota bacterium]
MEKLKEFHPQMYSYTSENTLNATLNNTFNELNSEQNLETYFRKIAPLIEMIRCSHTGIRLPGEYQQLAYEYGNYFPLELFFKENKAYYIANSRISEEGVISGNEVLSINNVPVEEIIGQLLSFIPSEGHCLTTKYCELNQNFQSYYYLLDHSENFNVEFLGPSTKMNFTFQACKYNMVNPDRSPDEKSLPVKFFPDRNKEADMIKISSFAIRDIDGYIQLMDSLFQSLEKSCTPNLVVDLRDNKGGHPIYAAQLLSYLTDKEFTYFRRNQDVEEFEPLYNPMQPSQFHYGGNIYVFVNGACLSTTGHLISLLKYHTDAMFVGEEPGSTFQCNDFSIQITLPNTGIEANIPRTTFETAVTGFSREQPFSVDYDVDNTVTGVINENDRYMEFLYDLMEQQNSNP